MPTNVLERLEKQSIALEQKKNRQEEQAARHKTLVQKACIGMLRSAGLFDREPKALHARLLFEKSLEDIAAENGLDLNELYRELLASARRKVRREPLPVAAE